MKAISLWQPWATLIALEEKLLETRGRRINHRGETAIHAAQKWTPQQADCLDREPFRSRLAHHGISRGNAVQDNMPRGAIVAVVDLVEVYLTGDCLDYAHKTRDLRGPNGLTYQITPQEIAFGDYTPGRYYYVLKNIRRLYRPVLCRGMQAMPFALPSEVEESIRKQLKERA